MYVLSHPLVLVDYPFPLRVIADCACVGNQGYQEGR